MMAYAFRCTGRARGGRASPSLRTPHPSARSRAADGSGQPLAVVGRASVPRGQPRRPDGHRAGCSGRAGPWAGHADVGARAPPSSASEPRASGDEVWRRRPRRSGRRWRGRRVRGRVRGRGRGRGRARGERECEGQGVLVCRARCVSAGIASRPFG